MKPINLRPHEALALAATGRVLAIRDNPKHPAAGDPWVWAALLRREATAP